MQVERSEEIDDVAPHQDAAHQSPPARASATQTRTRTSPATPRQGTKAVLASVSPTTSRIAASAMSGFGSSAASRKVESRSGRRLARQPVLDMGKAELSKAPMAQDRRERYERLGAGLSAQMKRGRAAVQEQQSRASARVDSKRNESADAGQFTASGTAGRSTATRRDTSQGAACESRSLLGVPSFASPSERRGVL